MNTKKFVLWQLKKWLPLIIVTTVALASFFSIFCISTRTWHVVYHDSHPSYHITYGNMESPTAGIFYAGFVFTFIIPWVAQNYHFKKISADAYRQFPADDRKIRNTKFLLGFMVLAFSFTVAFIFGMSIFGIRLLSTPKLVVPYNEYVDHVRNTYNWGMFALEYFFMLVAYFLEYSFNSFILSLCGTKNAALISLLTANIVLATIIIVPIFMFTENNIFALFGGIVNYGFLFHLTVDALATGRSVNNALVNEAIIMGLFNLVVCGGASALFLTNHEASGEHFGAPGSRFKWAPWIIDASLILCLSLLGTFIVRFLGSVSYLYILAVPGFALHYAAIVLFNKRSKPTKREVIVMILALIAYVFSIAVSRLFAS